MRAFWGAPLALSAALAVSATVGCQQVGVVAAKRSFKLANTAYQAQDYRKAAELYEEAVTSSWSSGPFNTCKRPTERTN